MRMAYQLQYCEYWLFLSAFYLFLTEESILHSVFHFDLNGNYHATWQPNDILNDRASNSNYYL